MAHWKMKQGMFAPMYGIWADGKAAGWPSDVLIAKVVMEDSARLIVRAPELLEAAEAVVKAVRTHDYPELERAIEMCDQVVSKVREG